MSYNTEDYTPHPGSNTAGSSIVSTERPGSYANLDILLENLEILINELDIFEKSLTEEISHFSLVIDHTDIKLAESHLLEWPKEGLGSPGDYVSFDYYKALKSRGTTSAAYICKRYEEAARDVTGTCALDLLSVVGIMQKEALLIQEFINDFIDKVNDSSEHRTIELFQDWVQSALSNARELWSFFQERDQRADVLDVEGATPAEAKQGQAVFKTELNRHNNSIVKNLDYLQKNFSEFAEVFYDKYLGPALNVRLNVSRRAFPTGSKLSREIVVATESLDEDLRAIVADQMRRHHIFESKIEELREDLYEQNKNRSYIHQLTGKGKPLPQEGPRIMVRDVTQSEEEIAHWEKVQRDNNPAPTEATGSFIPSHGFLADLEEDHHQQYLRKSGGVITGEIHFEEDAKIDFMRPSTHQHTGEDGTIQIPGTAIIPGTLPDISVEPSNPVQPELLSIVSHDHRTIPPGPTTVFTTVSWQGAEDNTFDLQLAKISFEEEDDFQDDPEWWHKAYIYRRPIVIHAPPTGALALHPVTVSLHPSLVESNKVRVDDFEDVEVIYGNSPLDRVVSADSEGLMVTFWLQESLAPDESVFDEYKIYYGNHDLFHQDTRPSDGGDLDWPIHLSHDDPLFVYTRPGEHWRNGASDTRYARAGLFLYSTQFRIISERAHNRGIMEVQVDNGPWEEVDLFALSATIEPVYEKHGLSPHELHEIRIRVSGRNNPSSIGNTINIVGVDYRTSVVAEDLGEEMGEFLEWSSFTGGDAE